MSLFTNLEWLRKHPVTRQHPLRTWGRWLYWQVRQRFTTRPKLIPFANGARLAVYPHEGLTGYWYVDLPDYEEMVFLQRYLRAEDVFYDVGSNAGAFAVFAASFGCRVVAFEPIPEAYSRLKENMILNAPTCSIDAVNEAVGKNCGTLRMTTGFGTGNHALKEGESGPHVEVAMTTLDECLLTRPAPTFIKIDVEGHELDVVLGATSLLDLPGLDGLLLETFRSHNWGLPNLQELERLLSLQGFKPFSYDPDLNVIFPLKRPDEGDNNTFYFRDPERITLRLLNREATAPAHRSAQ